MVPMSVEEIAKAVDGRLIGDAGSESRATNTVSDSRQAGPGSVFVAIRGERVDGHDFVAKTAGQGATVAIVDHEVKSDGLPQIVVKDTVDALGELARYNIVRRRELDGDFDIIGLTGSVGKTTTKDLLSSLLATVGPTVAPVGSFNNEIGLPLTALRVDEHTRFFVAEMGASHIGEIARLTRIAPPNTAIVLKVGVAHLGEFGSRERIAQAKSANIFGILKIPSLNQTFCLIIYENSACSNFFTVFSADFCLSEQKNNSRQHGRLKIFVYFCRCRAYNARGIFYVKRQKDQDHAGI